MDTHGIKENFTFEDKQDNDIARTHAMDSNQGGTKTDTARTATELQLIQVNTNVRLDSERAAVLKWYIQGVTKFSTLVQRIVTVEQAAQIVGPQRAQAWAQVMAQEPAPLAFFAMPDSAIRIDAAQRRKMAIETYAFLRNDPTIETGQLLKKSVLPALNLDSSAIKPPAPPPPPQPDPPKVSISVKGEDLIPFAPQYPGVRLVLKSSGLDVNQLPPPQLPPPTLNPGLVQPEKGLSGAKQDVIECLMALARKANIPVVFTASTNREFLQRGFKPAALMPAMISVTGSPIQPGRVLMERMVTISPSLSGCRIPWNGPSFPGSITRTAGQDYDLDCVYQPNASWSFPNSTIKDWAANFKGIIEHFDD